MAICPNCFRQKELCENCELADFSAHHYEKSFEQLVKENQELRETISDLSGDIARFEKAQKADWFRGQFHKEAFDLFVETLKRKNPRKEDVISARKSEAYASIKLKFRKEHGHIE